MNYLENAQGCHQNEDNYKVDKFYIVKICRKTSFATSFALQTQTCIFFCFLPSLFFLPGIIMVICATWNEGDTKYEKL